LSLTVDIVKRFANFELSVALEAGDETLGFLGESGSGKSLTMRCIAGLEKPEMGRIVVNDRVFFDSAAKINLTPQERKTAMLFQDYQLFPNLTVAQNIAAGIDRRLSRDEAEGVVSEQLELFGLKGFGKRFPAGLSGGQKQRVALARMLVAKPEILMLDEPFSALDSHLKSGLEQEMLDLFESFRGTILYVSHDIDEACRFCDRIAIVNQGRLAEIGAPGLIIDNPSSLATLKVSGVKNISPARRIDGHRVLAEAWNMVLACADEVPHDVAWLGFRATYVSTAAILSGDADCEGERRHVNRFTFEVVRVSDSCFERTVILRHEGGESNLQWKADKLLVREEDMPARGGHVELTIPPDTIYLVSR
jgi:molybdate transport system ATP-binding protein